MSELFKNAITGGNMIPTVLLILVVLYWIIVIIGVLDLDFLDVDLDLDAGDAAGPFYAILAFLKVGDLPFMFVISILSLNFWIIAMLMYYLPIAPGGAVNTVLLLPAMVLSIIITKYECLPLKAVFKNSSILDNADNEAVVIRQLCKLKSDVSSERLGQAEIERDGASLIINVKPEFEEETFHKDEVACVFRKDNDRDVYYIVKVEGVI